MLQTCSSAENKPFRVYAACALFLKHSCIFVAKYSYEPRHLQNSGTSGFTENHFRRLSILDPIYGASRAFLGYCQIYVPVSGRSLK